MSKSYIFITKMILHWINIPSHDKKHVSLLSSSSENFIKSTNITFSPIMFPIFHNIYIEGLDWIEEIKIRIIRWWWRRSSWWWRWLTSTDTSFRSTCLPNVTKKTEKKKILLVRIASIFAQETKNKFIFPILKASLSKFSSHVDCSGCCFASFKSS